jgi:hypothetical protein
MNGPTSPKGRSSTGEARAACPDLNLSRDYAAAPSIWIPGCPPPDVPPSAGTSLSGRVVDPLLTIARP